MCDPHKRILFWKWPSVRKSLPTPAILHNILLFVLHFVGFSSSNSFDRIWDMDLFNGTNSGRSLSKLAARGVPQGSILDPLPVLCIPTCKLTSFGWNDLAKILLMVFKKISVVLCSSILSLSFKLTYLK